MEKEPLKRAEPRATTQDGLLVYCSFDEILPLSEIHPNPKNPNRHPPEQIKLLAHIIKEKGWRAPITMSRRSGLIVKGHGRLEAARAAKSGYAPVEWQDYASETDELEDLMADNRIAELADMDDEAVLALLAELEAQGAIDLSLTGYDEEAVEALRSAMEDDEGSDGELDRTPEEQPDAPSMTRPGDIWLLGRHRLMCGDATKREDVDALMDGETAQLVHTDPPYGVEYTGGDGKTWDAIEGDDKTGDDLLATLLLPAMRNYVAVTDPEAAFYIWHASATRRDFEDAMTAAGLVEKQYLIWAKNSPNLGHADYQWAHEPCFYAEKAGQHAHWHGDRAQPTVWKVLQGGGDGLATVLTGGVLITDGAGGQLYVTDKPPKGKKTRRVRVKDGLSVNLYPEEASSTLWQVARETGAQHPTQKPVELAVRAINNSSAVGDLVVDFFGGSGSTLMGAEATGRRCNTMELTGRYCDLIVRRYVDVAGANNVFCIRGGERLTLATIQDGAGE